jgi:hypothetical protein
MPDAKYETLVASVVTTTTLDTGFYSKIELVNRGDYDVYVRLDGTNPTVEGADTILLPARSTLVEEAPEGTVAVKWISAGTPKVYVRGF